MQIFLLILFFCFIFFLFCLYYLGKDDYVLLRRNVSLDHLFNIAICAIISGLFFSRLIYVVFHPSSLYLNPLVFLAFPYYPGLSLIGGMLGGVLYTYLFCLRKKYPFSRILDLFALSFLAAIPYGILGSLFLETITVYSAVFIAMLYFILFIFCLKLLHPKLLRGNIKEGKISTLFFMCYGVFSLLLSIVSHKKGIYYFLGIDDFLSIVLFIIAFIFYLRSEKVGRKKA